MFLVLDYAKYTSCFPQFLIQARNTTFSQLAQISREVPVAEIKMNSFSITPGCLQAYLPILLSSKIINVIRLFKMPSLT